MNDAGSQFPQLFSSAWWLLPLAAFAALFKSAWFKGLMGEAMVNLVARLFLDKKGCAPFNSNMLAWSDPEYPLH